MSNYIVNILTKQLLNEKNSLLLLVAVNTSAPLNTDCATATGEALGASRLQSSLCPLHGKHTTSW